MKEKMVVWLVGMILERINSEEVSKWLCAGVEMLRKLVQETPNKYDDMVVLPMLDVLEEIIAKK